MNTTVTTKARRGVFSLLGRQLITFPISFMSGILLARLLGPSDFGTYATISLLVMGSGLLLDVGLGAIVIQQAEEPSPALLRSVFTAQLAVFGSAALAVMAGAHWMAGWFHLPGDGAWLLRAMALHMVLGVFGTNSTLLLERRLQFQVFAKLDVLNVLLDRGITLALAASGWGVWSFVVGSLVAMVCRMALLLRAAPWPMGWALDRVMLRRAFGFGAFLQATNMTSLLRDNMNTLLGGSFFGPQAVGYLNWGSSLPQTCSMPLTQILGRVCFPAFARLHDEPAERERLLVGSLRVLNWVSVPLLLLLIPLGPGIVTFLYTDKWRPALLALDCFALRMIAGNVTSLLIGYLNATGRVSVGFRISALWTVAEWALALVLLGAFGFNGIAFAYGIGAYLPALWLLYLVRGEVTIPYGRAFGLPLGVGLGISALAYGASPLIGERWILFAVASGCLMLALGLGALLERQWLVAAVASFRAGRGTPDAKAAEALEVAP